MTEQDKQRIEKDAQKWSDIADLYYDENGFETSYIAGATAEHERMAELLKEERNKAIDDVIDWAKEEKSSTLSNYGASIYEDLIRKLESLKSQ